MACRTSNVVALGLATLGICQLEEIPEVRRYVLQVTNNREDDIEDYIEDGTPLVCEGSGDEQQLWTTVRGTSNYCLDIAAGFGCQLRCEVALSCNSQSGSGLSLATYSSQTCMDDVDSEEMYLSHLSWTEVLHFFGGGCVNLGGGRIGRFDGPWLRQDWPNCSGFALDRTVPQAGPSYIMETFYDSTCLTKTPQEYIWRSHLDDINCFDVIDRLTPNQTKHNLKFSCSQNSGNGIVVDYYRREACAGVAESPIAFASEFFLLSWSEIDESLFRGLCTELRDGTFGKFERGLDSDDYRWPGCAHYAMPGYPASTVVAEYDPVYQGNIGTIREDDESSTARRRRGTRATASGTEFPRPMLAAVVLVVSALLWT